MPTGAPRPAAQTLLLTIEIAERLGCPRRNALYGNVEPDHPRSHYQEAALEAYCYACAEVAAIEAQVMIEPINTPDAPGYGVRSIRGALALRNEVTGFGLPPIGILLDVYRLALDQQGIKGSDRRGGRGDQPRPGRRRSGKT